LECDVGAQEWSRRAAIIRPTAVREVEVAVVLDRSTRPTSADVARLAKVSQATVSYVLNNTEGQKISEKTQSAVWAAARQLGYRPNLAARNLKVGGGGIVLFIVPRMGFGEMPFEVGSQVTKILAREGIVLSMQFETDDGSNVIDAIADLDPVAVASTFPLTGDVAAAVAAAGIPQISLGDEHLGVLAELNSAVGHLQVQHLTSRGHRRLGFVFSDVVALRPLGEYYLAGVRAAAHESGLPDVEVATVATDGTDAAHVVRRWVDDGVTAACAQTDPTAFVVLHGVRRAGLRCPQDLAVIGVDANPSGHVSSPPLTSIAFDATAIVAAAASGIMDALGYPTRGHAARPSVARLVVRDST
jgi:DNA-binding LacI/PurR family transcriptional regulator